MNKVHWLDYCFLAAKQKLGAERWSEFGLGLDGVHLSPYFLDLLQTAWC